MISLVPLARLERAAHGLGIRCSVHLSYRGDGCNYTISLPFRQRNFLIFFSSALRPDQTPTALIAISAWTPSIKLTTQ